MATPAPAGLDVTELKFTLQNKVPIFNGDGNVKDRCSLLAAASVHGLIFAGTTGPQLKVLQLKDITPDKVIDEAVPLRTIPLPSEPLQLAVSSDHGFLAVDVVVAGVPMIQIYSVPSFLTPSVVKLYEIRVSPEGGIRSTQILWNPVIHNMFSVRTENGALSVYTLKEPSGIEFHSLDKNEGAISACWSPKGKQLVIGFANGKLMQYKPDLKPARTIACPPGVMEGSFDVIAVQWLSTYQFAAVYLPHAEDSVPSLFIVNAPKAGNPTFVNYDDICYSQSGPRGGQVFLIHILQWNLLLMASANSMEVGILGTTETGETPTWYQWTTTDEARAELPLSSTKQETLPIGFALETGCTHEITISEKTIPVMPMIHLLSTYGLLVSFNVLNLAPNVTNICSPPRPVTDTSGKFEKVVTSNQTTTPVAVTVAPVQPAAEITFTVPTGATSTPAITKTKSFFSPSENKSPMNLFGVPNAGSTSAAPPAVAPTFGKQISFGSMAAPSAETVKTSPFGGGNSVSFGNQGKPFAPTTTTAVQQTQPSLLKTGLGQLPSQQQQQQQQQQKVSNDASKPFITIPPTYTPPTPANVSRSNSTESVSKASQKQPQKKQELGDDTNSIIRTMIAEEIRKFENELNDLQKRCSNLNTTIGSKEESATIIKNLKELQDLSEQAAESTESLTSDVQALRLGLNEAFAMVAEANSKNAIYKHPSPNLFQETHAMSQSSRRQLASLQNMFALNENQLHIVNKQIDAQWSVIQEANRTNNRRRMHVPSLEVLYQTLSKQQDILNKQKEKLSYIKAKIGMRECIRGLDKDRKKNPAMIDNVDSLTDSIVSMSIVDQVREDAHRLSEAKMSSLRDMLKNRKVVTIKPRRPDRVGLNSEVVRERRNEVHRMDSEKTKVEPTAITKPPTLAPTKKVESKPEVQSNIVQPVAVAEPTKPSVVKEPTKVLDLPKAIGPPNFGVKPTTSTAQQSTKNGSFGFAATSQASATTVTNKPSAVVFGASGGAPSPSIFSFGQPTAQPNGQNTAPKDTPITKETTLFGNTTIKPIAASSTSTKNKENQEPASKPTLFGFGSTTIQAVPKSESAPTAEPAKPILSFGAPSNGKTAFSFGNSTGGPVTFGALQPTASTLNLAKERDPEPRKDDKPKEDPKKSEPLPPTTGASKASEEGTKASFPALTNLLQKGDSTTVETKSQTIFGTTTKTTSSSIFGSSTATIAPGTGLFGSIKPATTTTTATSSSGSFPSFKSGDEAITEAATTTTTPSTTSTATTTITETTSTVTSTSTSLFGSVKPVVTTSAGTGFSFGGTAGSGFSFAAASDKPTDLSIKSEPSSSEAKPTVNPTTATSAPLTTATVSSTPADMTAPAPAKVATTTVAPTTSSSVSFSAINLATTTTTTPSTPTPTSTTDSTSNLFGSFSICSPATPAAEKPSSGNIFGSTSFSTPKAETTSIFGGGSTSTFGTTATETSKPASIFGSTAAAVTSASSPSGTGLFGSVATSSAASGGSIFGTANSTTSTFGSSTGGFSSLFGSVATTSSTPSSGSIFGGATAGSQQPSSPFGAATTPATTASSIFGNTGASSGGGLFGSVTTSATGGSIFGGSAPFGSSIGTANTSSGNIFGGAAAGAPTAGGFGTTTFGQPSSPQSGQSIFGGAASNTSGFGSSSFGSPSPSGGAFSTPTTGSVAQSGFGSPGSSAFNKPTFAGTTAFGGTPSFGGAPAFGGSTVFGGSPSFGSKPMFGGSTGFGQAPLSPSNQSNSLFEQLGSSSTGVSFGNLAQPQAEKPPQFGGSSFSSWR